MFDAHMRDESVWLKLAFVGTSALIGVSRPDRFVGEQPTSVTITSLRAAILSRRRC